MKHLKYFWAGLKALLTFALIVTVAMSPCIAAAVYDSMLPFLAYLLLFVWGLGAYIETEQQEIKMGGNYGPR